MKRHFCFEFGTAFYGLTTQAAFLGLSMTTIYVYYYYYLTTLFFSIICVTAWRHGGGGESSDHGGKWTQEIGTWNRLIFFYCIG